MEPASLGVILDSSVAVEAERQHLNVAQFLRQIVQKVDLREAALCSITFAEIGAWDLPGGHSRATGTPQDFPR
jgi:hypothetical protein